MSNRRKFIKTGAYVAAGAVISGKPVNAEESTESNAISGYNYKRPKLAKGTRLVFQGDSITDMKWGRNEKDRNHYLGHSYVFLIASRLFVDMPDAQLDFYNRGYSGHTVGALKKRWERDTIKMKPDLLSILVGVNDVRSFNLKQWTDDYRYLLESSRKANPKLKIVLLDPFVLKSGRLKDEKSWKHYRGIIEQQIPVVHNFVKEFDTAHVKTQEIFDQAAKDVSPEHWIWDGVHPLPGGHELIARHWIKAISEKWT